MPKSAGPIVPRRSTSPPWILWEWAAELQYEVADFAHKMGQAKKFQVSMDSVLAQYKQNQDDGELTHTQKKQRTEEQQNSQEQVKASAPSDSTQTQQLTVP